MSLIRRIGISPESVFFPNLSDTFPNPQPKKEHVLSPPKNQTIGKLMPSTAINIYHSHNAASIVRNFKARR